MKVLISAYACETGRGSEGEIAWRLIHQLAQRHEIWVITRANLRDTHDAIFRQMPKPAGLNIVYFDLPWILRFYKRGKRFFLLYYYLWQIGSGLLARRLEMRERFDLCHHLTGGMDWMPAGLTLCSAPLLWGPIGSEDTHPVIIRTMTMPCRAKDALRRTLRGILRRIDPGVRLSGRRARMVLTHTAETMPGHLADKLVPFTQTGIEDVPELARPKTDFSRNGSLRILFAGELKDWKGAELALRATLRCLDQGLDVQMTIAGDGPLRRQLERRIADHPAGNRVTLLGRVSMPDLVQRMRDSDLFLYPSYHHGLATVVLQAMLTGLPVVCLEGDATGRTVRQEAGITVALADGRDPVTDLADAIAVLANDEETRQSLARAAQRIARTRHGYPALARALEDTYRTIGRRRS